MMGTPHPAAGEQEGPNLTEGEKAILSVISVLTTELRESNDERRSQYNELKGKVDSSLSAITQSVSSVTSRVDSHDEIFLKKDKEGRRRNIILYGMKGSGKENPDQLEEKISDLFRNTLKLNFDLDRDLDQVIRLGVKSNENRPVLVRFKAIRKKIEAITKRGNLKNTKIYMEDDYTREEQEERKSKMEEVKKLRNAGKVAYLSGTKIVTKERNYQQERDLNVKNTEETLCMEVEENTMGKNKSETPKRKRSIASPLKHGSHKKLIRSNSVGKGNSKQGDLGKWLDKKGDSAVSENSKFSEKDTESVEKANDQQENKSHESEKEE